MANVVAVAIVIAVTTSVQVSKKTLQLLQRLKKELAAKSHDQVIRDLIANRKRIPRPMLGFVIRNSDPSQSGKRQSLMGFSYVIDTCAWIGYFRALLRREEGQQRLSKVKGLPHP